MDECAREKNMIPNSNSGYENKFRNSRKAEIVLGKHSVIELHDCDPLLLGQVAKVRETLVIAAQRCGATIVEVVFHEFNPHGVSGIVVIAESHLAIHTWPEHRYAAIDLFTCGDTLCPDPAAEYIAKEFRAASWHIYKIPRGRFNQMGQPIQSSLHIRAEITDNRKQSAFMSLQSRIRFLFSATFLQWVIDYFNF